MNPTEAASLCEEKQFDRVYREQVKSVYRFSYYQTGNKAAAEDLLQEAFLKLWENCQKVNIGSVKAFLFKVVKNRYLNKIDRKKVAQKFVDQVRFKSDPEHPAYLLEQKEFHQQLLNAIDQLPTTQKEVFLLNRIDQLKYREIAELLGISQKAVEKRMHKALVELRKIYDRI
ncbi:MAG: RNA polymerase sigma-70 factor [Bacteroidota bacterium]